MDTTIIDAFMELLNVDAVGGEFEYPETLAMDKERIIELAAKSLRLCVCASALSIASAVPIIGQIGEHKRMIKQQIMVLLQSVRCEK